MCIRDSKTTITNLINRFYDIADGKIRYDGININKIKKDVYKRQGFLYHSFYCDQYFAADGAKRVYPAAQCAAGCQTCLLYTSRCV